MCLRELVRWIQSVKLGEAISIIFASQSHNGFATVLHNTAVTKQWMAKWPYIANVVFRIVKSYG